MDLHRLLGPPPHSLFMMRLKLFDLLDKEKLKS